MPPLLAAVLLLLACSSPPAPAPPTVIPSVTPEPSATAPPPPRPTTAPPALSPASSPIASSRVLVQGTPVASTRPRAAQLGALSDAGLAIGVAKGFFAEQGLDPQLAGFGSGGQALQALATGELEVASLPISADLFNALGRGTPIKIVAEAAGAPPGHGAAGLLVRPDLVARLGTPTDLRGFRVGLPMRGGGLETELAQLLRQGWLARSDVETVVLAPEDLGAALVEGALDAAMLLEPLLSQLESRGIGRVWRRSDQIIPNRLSAVLVFSARFIHSQPEDARRFLTAYLKALRLYNDAVLKGQADRREVIEILSRTTGAEPAALDRAVLPGANPNGMLNVESLNLDQRYFLASGLQQRPLDLPASIDTQFTTYAITQLGEYR